MGRRGDRNVQYIVSHANPVFGNSLAPRVPAIRRTKGEYTNTTDYFHNREHIRRYVDSGRMVFKAPGRRSIPAILPNNYMPSGGDDDDDDEEFTFAPSGNGAGTHVPPLPERIGGAIVEYAPAAIAAGGALANRVGNAVGDAVVARARGWTDQALDAGAAYVGQYLGDMVANRQAVPMDFTDPWVTDPRPALTAEPAPTPVQAIEYWEPESPALRGQVGDQVVPDIDNGGLNSNLYRNRPASLMSGIESVNGEVFSDGLSVTDYQNGELYLSNGQRQVPGNAPYWPPSYQGEGMLQVGWGRARDMMGAIAGHRITSALISAGVPVAVRTGQLMIESARSGTNMGSGA